MFSDTIRNNSIYFKIIIGQFCLICLILMLVNPSAAEEDTLEEYLSDTRPDPRDKPTEIKIGVAVIDVDSINGADQSFTANVVITAQWEDRRLATARKGRRSLNLDEVWNPSLQIINQQKLFKTFPDVVEIAPEGTVIYRQRYWGTFSYPMNLRDFPLDKHSLAIKIAAAGYQSDDVKFVIDDERTGIADILTVTDWKIVSWEAYPESIKLGTGLPTASALIFEFRADRLVGFYVIKVLLPLALIIFMSCIIFFIEPVHVGPKFSIAITAMLTLIAYRFLLGNLLPKISYLTRMDYFLFGSTILVFAVLVETAITAKLMGLKKEQLAKTLDYWSRWIFTAAIIIILVVSFFV